ncbi:hypothetical protein [Kaistia terrae]|jgi:hypothetical protein|uniref:Uncharacterized protein n=1 Tax=Kaistia terrae TaxID=537017 RepID=A0ABW0PSB9_9HYPH|nr:hypothetical protein [Kaistia terrae]MCX5578188.1 hypothetical protein [Kaistia terrae]
MSAVSILALGAIISAFLVFMLSLAWAERQTRHLSVHQKPVEVRASIRAARPSRT